MSEQKINPKVVLEAARMCGLRDAHLSRDKAHVDYFNEGGGWYRTFDPLTSDDDAMKLERALKKLEWQFSYERDEFQASREHSKPIMVGGMPGQEISTELLSDDSDTLLLLKCVSAITGIPLHAKGVEG